MKYMLIMRGTDQAYQAYRELPFDQVIAAMGAYNESMIKAGVLVAGDGLAEEPGLVVDFSSEPPVVTRRSSSSIASPMRRYAAV